LSHFKTFQTKTKKTSSLTESNQIKSKRNETNHPNRLFSGILSCGFNIPVLGGRPYEIACEERRNARRLKRKSTTSTAAARGSNDIEDIDIEQNFN
jgi:hypothetical protein